MITERRNSNAKSLRYGDENEESSVQQAAVRPKRKSEKPTKGSTPSTKKSIRKEFSQKSLPSREVLPVMTLTDAIKAGEQLVAPIANPIEGYSQVSNTDVYRILEILLKSTGMESNLVSVAIQFVEQLIKNKSILPLGFIDKRKLLVSSMALTSKSIGNLDRTISAIKIQKTIRGFLVRRNLHRLHVLHSSVKWRERNSNYLDWIKDEEDYGNLLEIIIQEYKLPIEQKELIAPSDIEKIFSNLTILHETHRSVLAVLKSVIPTHPHIIGLGDKWCELAPFLRHYGAYVENSAHALTTLHRLSNTNPKFKSFIGTVCATGEICPLDELLNLPINRIAKYQNFLEMMLKNTPTRHPDFDALSKSHEVMKKASDFVEKNLAAAKNRDNILEVERRLNCEIPLYKEERTYVGEVPITIVIKGKKQARQFILFNDMALFAKQTKRDLMELKNKIVFNPSSEATDRAIGDPGIKQKKKQETPIIITNCESDIPGPVLLLFKAEEHETWLKHIQCQVNALKRASCVVFGAPLIEMIKKCIPSSADITFTTIEDTDGHFDTDSLVPPFLLLLVNQLETHLIESGIYRVSGLDTDIKDLRSQLDRVKPPSSISQFTSHVVADVIKLYFRELPEPLLNYDFYDMVIGALYKKNSDIDLYVATLGEMLRSLPLPNYCIIKFLSRHLYKVERYSAYNLMGSTNLAIVFGPTLLKPKIESIEHTLMMPRVYAVIQFLIEKFDILFKEKTPVLPVFENRPPLGATADPVISLSKPVKDEAPFSPSLSLTNSISEGENPHHEPILAPRQVNTSKKVLRPAKSVGRINVAQNYDSQKTTAERALAERTLTERILTERTLTERTPSERTLTERTPSERTPSERTLHYSLLEDNTDEILKNRNSLKSLYSDKKEDEKKAIRDRPVRSMRTRLSLKKSLSMISPREGTFNSLSGSLSARDVLSEDFKENEEEE